MPETVNCAKLGRELPAIDPNTSEGGQALRMVTLIGGPELRQRVQEHVSIDAWRLWKDHMLMVINEFRLDPTSSDSNGVLAQQMDAFFFGDQPDIPNYVPPEER